LGGDASLDTAVAYVEDLLSRLNGKDPSFLSNRLMELLQQVKKGDPIRYGTLAEAIARRAEGMSEFRRAREYWYCAADWHRMAKDTDRRNEALTAAAETFAQEAEQAAKTSSSTPNLLAASHLQRAVHALRKLGTPAARERANALYLRMEEHQQRSLSELISLNHTVDVTDLAASAKRVVSGITLDEAIQRVAGLAHSESKTTLRAEAEQRMGDPLAGFMSGTKLGSTGKIVGTRPHFETGEDAKERWLTAEMLGHARHHRWLVAQGRLVPAIVTIQREHQVRWEDFYRLAQSSSFVPAGRELTVAKGLFAGFTGDLIVSTHLLIPQVEESIRVLLFRRGVITSGFDRRFETQNEYDLTKTL
jgi:hypothetical protein